MDKEKYQEIFNSILIDTLRFTIDFLESHHLTYWAYWGTALGAVRENGLIPWDDDIDIAMPRTDYDKLIGYKQEIRKMGYQFLTYHDKGFYYAFGKMINLSTTLVESKHNTIVSGVFVDIYPLEQEKDLDSVNIKWYQYKKRRLAYLRTAMKHGLNDIRDLLKECDFKGAIRACVYSIFYSDIEKRLQKFIEIEKSLTEDEGEWLVDYCCSTDSTIYNHIYPIEWFSDSLKFQFNDVEIKVPKGYHQFLTKIYGDYMTPPPENERMLCHDELRYYINLKERLSLEEVKRRVAEGENFVI